LRTGSNINDQQEHVCETVYLLAALNNLYAAKSLSRKVKSMMSNGANTLFGSLKQLDAGLLNVGYVEAGPSGAPHLDASAYARKFSGRYVHRIITGGVGHNLPQEAPLAFAQAIIDVDNF